MLLQKYLFPKVLKQTGLKEGQLVINQDVWMSIIRPLGFDSGIRSLERTIEEVCRKSAMLIVEGKAQSVNVTAQNAREFLPAA